MREAIKRAVAKLKRWLGKRPKLKRRRGTAVIIEVSTGQIIDVDEYERLERVRNAKSELTLEEILE